MKTRNRSLIVFTILLALPAQVSSDVVLLPMGSQTKWRYHDGADEPGKDWYHRAFDDSTWKQGKAPLGYGDDLVETVLAFGDDVGNKRITAYFRSTFEVAANEMEDVKKLLVRLRRDDGAIVYLNGKEVTRSNMPPGNVTARTLATSSISGAGETHVYQYVVPMENLANDGSNTIAVEVHQSSPFSSDLIFDLGVEGGTAKTLAEYDFFRAGIEAYRNGQFENAAKLLGQVPEDHPAFAETMALLAHRIYCERLGRAEEGLPFIKKAYDREPENRSVVQAYLRTHVLSGVLFDESDIARERFTDVLDAHKFLVTKPMLGVNSRELERELLEQDLDYLEHILTNCFAYLEIRDVDYRRALDAIRNSLDAETPLNLFQLQIAKLISLFCDGHADVTSSPGSYLPKGYAPYVAGHHKGRVYLYDPRQSEFIDREFPYVTVIDGKPIDEWLKVAGYIVVKESRQWHRRQALRNLGLVNYIRAELGLDQKPEITLQLESEDEQRFRETTVSVQPRMPRARSFPHGETRRIEDVGYLRIPQMTTSRRFLDGLDVWMEQFRDTNGLIIDLRGNSGGSKHVLFRLFPYFMPPDAPMRILEMSVYRKPMDLPRPNPGGFMRSDMSGQPVTSSRWNSDAKRRIVSDFIDNFQTEWPLPKGKFSEWHVVALDASENPKAYYYDKPLVILQDSGSFSASDIFLGAFEDHPHTTLMGEPSGGGNGWQEVFYLPNSGVGLVLCQSAKFRPNGKLYDGEGITPDIILEATPDDIFGKTDTVLETAVKQLSEDGS